MKIALMLPAFLLVFLLQAYPQISLTVNTAKRVKVLNGLENGINLNYLMDGGYTSTTTSNATALRNMGVKLLRYPGGEKSDNYLWSAAPWTKAAPRMALRDTVNAWPTNDSLFVYKALPEKLCKPVVLDFDELMTLCKATGAQPLIVVAYDAMYNVKTADRPTRQQLITNAVEWVRYANITKKFGIKYWMIGNESWNNPEYNGRTTATQYAADVYAFATAMKAVDPSIKIIANGQNSWWPALLQSKAVPLIDILAFSCYPIYNYLKGYETYRTSTKSLTGDVDAAVKAINTYAPVAHRSRLKVLAAEYNSIDWSGAWKNDNNLGHALANFQLFGDMVVNPKVESVCLWNTRWTTNETTERHVYDAINKNGGLNATGTALRVWGQNLLQTVVASSSNNSRVKVYATYDTLKKLLNILILNKETAAKSVNLSIHAFTSRYSGVKYVFKGTSVGDRYPKYAFTQTITGAASGTTLKLAPASVTVLKLAPSMSPAITKGEPEAADIEATAE